MWHTYTAPRLFAMISQGSSGAAGDDTAIRQKMAAMEQQAARDKAAMEQQAREKAARDKAKLAAMEQQATQAARDKAALESKLAAMEAQLRAAAAPTPAAAAPKPAAAAAAALPQKPVVASAPTPTTIAFLKKHNLKMTDTTWE